MKSDIVEGRHYIECTCGSYDHLLVFEIDPDLFDDDDDIKFAEISVSFTSGYHERFLNRLKAACKYLFKKEKYLHISDSLIINQENLNQLKTVIKETEELAKTKKLI